MKQKKTPATGNDAEPGQGASAARSGPTNGSAAAAPLQIQSAELFAGRTELTIVHAREHYRLRITRNDKLILTK